MEDDAGNDGGIVVDAVASPDDVAVGALDDDGVGGVDAMVQDQAAWNGCDDCDVDVDQVVLVLVPDDYD